MKIIFIDIDGVLNSFDNMRAMYGDAVKHPDYVPGQLTVPGYCDEWGHLFDERCMRHFKRIIHETSAKLVMSSTWRFAGLQEMQAMWKKRELPGELIDITGRSKGSLRGEEIKTYLENCKHEVDTFCIIDDEVSDIRDFYNEDVIVHTDGEYGINLKNSLKAIKILKHESD